MATYVSSPTTQGGPSGVGTAGIPGAPGSGVIGANMSPAHAVGWLLVAAAGISLTTGYMGRKGVKPQIGHLDVFEVIFNAAGVAVVFGTAKVLAYRFHGHALSQAVLLVL